MGKTFANREVCNLVFCDYKTQVPFLNVDFANTTTTELTGEPVYAYGGQGHPKRVAFHGEKGGTIAFETQIQTMKLYSLITGGEITNSAKFIKREALTSSAAGVIELSSTPVAGTVYVYAADDDCGTVLESSVEGQNVTVSDVSSATDFIVYYIEELSSNVQKINIKSTTFPKCFTAYAETIEKTEDDEILPYKMIAYKCAPQSTVSLSFTNSGDPATMTVTCDLLADDNDNIMDMILLEG